jgi:peptide subunit release factor 1 (eRF1)
MLTHEIGTAKNIKCKTNRKSVIDAIKTIQAKITLIGNKQLPNGIVIFAGWCL